MDPVSTDVVSDDSPRDGAPGRMFGPAGSVSKRWLPVARAGWVLLAALLAAMFLVGNALYYRQSSAFPTVGNFVQGRDPEAYAAALAQIGLSTTTYARLMVGLQLAFMLGSAIIGLLIFIHKNDSWWYLFVSLTLVSLGASYPTTIDALTRAYPAWGPVFNLVDSLSLMCFLELFYLFPNGRFVPRWARGAGLAFAAVFLPAALFPGSIVDLARLGQVFNVVNAVFLISMVYAQAYRYRRVSGRVERQQTKWAIGGMLLAVLSLVALSFAPLIMPGLVSTAERGALYDMVATAALLIVVLAVPLSIGISMLRYRLWDVDLIINRTLVYVPLTGIVAGIFAVTTTTSQKLLAAFTGAKSDAGLILSTLLVVTTFTPIKNAIQGLVDRRFKGRSGSRQRLDALNEQMSWFNRMLDESQIAQRALNETIHALHAEGGAIYLARDNQLALAYRVGTWDNLSKVSISMPLESGGHGYGLFQVGERRDGLPYSREDERMLLETVNLLAQTIANTRRLTAASTGDSDE